MKIIGQFVQREIGGKTVAISVSTAPGSYQGMVSLNATGKLIWDMISEGLGREEIYSALEKQFEISPEMAKRDADAFIDKLVEAGVVGE